MIRYIRSLLELRLDYLERKYQIEHDDAICDSCEVLKLELAKAHDTINELLSKITKPNDEPNKPISVEDFKPVAPKNHLSFRMRRQMLEQEDRAKARALHQQREEERVPINDLTKGLEEELNIVEKEREAQTGAK